VSEDTALVVGLVGEAAADALDCLIVLLEPSVLALVTFSCRKASICGHPGLLLRSVRDTVCLTSKMLPRWIEHPVGRRVLLRTGRMPM
jgi:hypothetical protein